MAANHKSSTEVKSSNVTGQTVLRNWGLWSYFGLNFLASTARINGKRGWGSLMRWTNHHKLGESNEPVSFAAVHCVERSPKADERFPAVTADGVSWHLKLTLCPQKTKTNKEVKVIWQKAPHGGHSPVRGHPRGRKLYHWIPGVGFPISVP